MVKDQRKHQKVDLDGVQCSLYHGFKGLNDFMDIAINHKSDPFGIIISNPKIKVICDTGFFPTIKLYVLIIHITSYTRNKIPSKSLIDNN